ncbi:MAG: beta-xylosidase [Acidobacteria bacterium]|nr:MAG: beta-xylosidase [Acidobacteriota bacterium]
MKFLISLTLSLPTSLWAQQRVRIQVHADNRQGAFKTNWAYFGHDEPNFTYMKYGRQLLSELSAISPDAVHIRTHNLLTTGDGAPALKWGSTNAYTEDASGRPIYNWTVLDKIFDTYHAARITPFVEIGFMPKALSVHPDPYQHDWPKGALWTGWAYPPKDYAKWAELIRRWVLHSVERYGRQDVESWEWEVWNEPDIGYWQGTPEEYYQLYDYAVDAVKRALPAARVGGPATTNPGNPKAAEFLRNFLTHCRRGKNYATGNTGAPLDFISFHAKGSVRMVDGHVQMDIRRHLNNIAKGFEIVASFAEFRTLPVVLSESDPEGCAACSAAAHPEDAYRNTPQYASYTAAVLQGAGELAKRYKIDLQGILTWAFEFEDQPYFAGFRALATRDIDLPVFNLFRMLGLMGGERIRAESSAALGLDSALNSGARTAPDVNALATLNDRQVTILVWNYQDDDVAAPSAIIDLTVEGILRPIEQGLLRHFRIDQTTSNAFTTWREMGSPEEPRTEQHAQLKAAGQLQLVSPPQRLELTGHAVHLNFELPSQGVSLIQLSW